MNLPLAMTREFVEDGRITIKDLEKIIAEIKRRGSPQVLSEDQQHRNDIKMKLFKSLNY